jgi:serine/threonine-protein kinase
LSEEPNSAAANASPGDTIAGYRLEEQIGQGGMAVVYRAHDERLDRSVALKLLTPGLASDTAFRTRFIRESRAAAAVDHPNIIPVYDAGDAGGYLFIAMRYVQGGDVRSLFASGQTLSPARVWNIVSQVASALDAAHAHDLIHRDVKPANILLDTSSRTTGGKRGQVGDETDHVYLSDFGISKQTLASHLTSTGQFVGTLDYIAPETIEGKTIDGAVDQYSLACAAYELLTGDPPYQRDLGLALLNAHLSTPPPKVTDKRPELPPAMDLVIAKAMAKNASDRYASCVEFATDLGKAIGMVPGTPMVVTAGAQPTAAAGNQVKPTAHPMTELASPITAAEAIPGPGQQTPPSAPVTNQPIAAAIGTPPPTQATPPPQQFPPQPVPGQPVQGQPGPQWPAGVPGGFDAGTQYAPQQTGGPQGAGQFAPGQFAPGQTPPPQQMPGQQPWQTGQQPPVPGYAPYPPQGYPPQQQPYGTGPIGPPIQGTGPIGPPVQGWQQPYPQGGPSGPNWPQQPQPQQNKNRGLLIGAVIATLAVAAAAVAVVYLVIVPNNKHNNANGGGGPSTSAPVTTPPSSSSSSSVSTPPPSTQPPQPTARGEATQMNNLLLESSSSRGNIQPLVTDVQNCGNVNSDVTAIGDIASERSSELNQAKNLQVSAIPNGASLKSDLMDALSLSLQIDQDYYHWAQQQLNSSCGTGLDSTYYEDANNQDPNASAAKANFLDLWDPIASQYNLTQFNDGQI